MRFKAFGWLNIAAQASPRSVSRNGGRRSRLCFPETVGAALAFVEPFHGDLSVDKVDFYPRRLEKSPGRQSELYQRRRKPAVQLILILPWLKNAMGAMRGMKW